MKQIFQNLKSKTRRALATLAGSRAGRRMQPFWRKFRGFSRRTQYAIMAAIVLGTMLPIVLGGQHVSASTMTKSPTAGASVAGVGTASWTSPTNIYSANDGLYATASLSKSTTSYYLEATGYGFSIPSNAIINGIQVSTSDYTNMATGYVYDNSVQMLQTNTTPVGSNKAVTTTPWQTVNWSSTYGSSSDLWGLSWTPAQLNASTFGVALSVSNTYTRTGTYTAYVDYIGVTVTYTVPSTYNQAAYRWMQNSYAVPPLYPISEHISSGHDAATNEAIDPTGGYMYTVGYDSNTANSTYEWRIEKRSLSTGALVSGFGTGGAISEDISTSSDVPDAVALDTTNGYMYVGGYDSNGAGSYSEWRIEKRSLSTGALVSGFGTGGAISEDVSTYADDITAIAIDTTPTTGGYMYVAGYDQIQGTNATEWRIEKRNLSDGSPVSGFGTSGASGQTYGAISEHISSYTDQATAIAIDPAGYMYVAGFDGNTSGGYSEWRIEKRNLSDGSLVSGFGTGGAISEHISTGYNDQANAIAIDTSPTTGGYMYVAGFDGNTSGGLSEWRIEKRSLSTGTLSYGVSEHISSYSDQARSVAIDPTGGYMYVGGNDANVSGLEWHMEKRNLSDGGLVSGFGTSGAISEHISAAAYDGLGSLAIDTTPTTGGYMYVVGEDQNATGNYYEWRIESRDLSTGNFKTAADPTPLAAANTAMTSPAGAFRLRLLLGVSVGDLAQSGQYFQLAEAQMTSGTCASQTYSTVVSATSPIAFYTNPAISDGVRMSKSTNQDPKDGANLIDGQDYLSSNANFTNNKSLIPAGQDGEWDISLYNYSASPGTTWCFEVQKSGGTTLDTYTQYPQLTTSSTSYTQAGYRWYQNANQSPAQYPISEHISSSSDLANATAIDPTGGYMYTVGDDQATGGTAVEWHIEKRSLSTGALSYGISEHISSSNDVATSIAIDSTGGYMYVAGYDSNTTGNYKEWRIEKRNLSDGSLVSGFGTGGAISEHISSFSDMANTIAIDPTGGYMYVAGYDESTPSSNSQEWHIEKRSLSTGALSYGISEHISTSSTGQDQASSIAIDPTGGYMYVAGYDSNATGPLQEWRIEKRNFSDGSLVSGFGTSGAISEHISTYNDVANSIAIDPTGGYMYVAGYDSNASSNRQEWRIEKRSLSTGTLSYGVSEHVGSATNDQAYSIAIDPTGGYMYVVGADSNTSGSWYEWRIEKRNFSDGSLVSGFGTSGAISEPISSGTGSTRADVAKGIAIDTTPTTGGYMYVAGYDSNTTNNYFDEWRIESRSLSDGGSKTLSLTPLLQTNASTNQFHPGDIVRLRILIGVGGSMINSSGQTFKLQEAAANGSCSNSLNYADVSSSSGAVRFYTGNTNLTDGSGTSTMSSDATDGYNTVMAQDYLSSNTNFTNNQGLLRPTQDGEWDIALQVNSTNIGGVCFRVVTGSGGLLNTYNYFPSLGVHALPSQRLRLGKQLVGGTKSGLDMLKP